MQNDPDLVGHHDSDRVRQTVVFGAAAPSLKPLRFVAFPVGSIEVQAVFVTRGDAITVLETVLQTFADRMANIVTSFSESTDAVALEQRRENSKFRQKDHPTRKAVESFSADIQAKRRQDNKGVKLHVISNSTAD